MRRYALTALLSAGTMLLFGCAREEAAIETAPAGERDAVWPAARLLSEQQPGGWRAIGAARHYSRETLFEYIDGGAAFYLGYDFRECAVRDYEKQGERVAAELYDMGSPGDAYGVFHWDLPPDRPGIGKQASYEAGLLKVWAGRFFLRILADREVERTRGSLIALARGLLADLPPEGDVPEMVRSALSAGVAPDSIRYFHQRETLNAIRYYDAWGELALSPDTEAVWGRLPSGGDLLAIEHPTATAAEVAGRETGEALGREGVGGFAAVGREEKLIIVLGMRAPSAAKAEAERLAKLL